MPAVHIEQSKHNTEFHTSICDKFPEKFYDWKITVLFYTGLHCIKAYYKNKGISIGDTHIEIERSINPNLPNAPYKVTKTCWDNYKALYRYSHTARI